MGTPIGRALGARYLREFIEEMKDSGSSRARWTEAASATPLSRHLRRSRELNIRRLSKWVAALVGDTDRRRRGIEVVEYRAEMHARAFCERFPIGTSMQDVTKAAASEGDPALRVLLSDHIAIGYTASRLPRATCAWWTPRPAR